MTQLRNLLIAQTVFLALGIAAFIAGTVLVATGSLAAGGLVWLSMFAFGRLVDLCHERFERLLARLVAERERRSTP